MSNERDVRQMGDLVISTASESRDRAALLPTKPTENARHILGTLALPDASRRDEVRDYLPEPAVSWVVDVRFDGDPQLDPRQISAAFDKKWRKKYGNFMAYGRDVDTGRWTYLISGDGPKTVDQLKFAFDYIDVLDEDALPADLRVYAQRLEQLTQHVRQFGQPTVTTARSPAEAAEQSALLQAIRSTLDTSAVLVLKAPAGKKFDGKQVWDVMLCLGLEWGDMDCFHWQNNSGVGDDSFFSVETTTSPGYFLPERVAAGKVHVDDLVFVYSVPRSAKPVEVFDAMLRAVEYCKLRLGGTIIDGDENPPSAMRQQVVEITQQLHAAGFQPGADATLQLF